MAEMNVLVKGVECAWRTLRLLIRRFTWLRC